MIYTSLSVYVYMHIHTHTYFRFRGRGAHIYMLWNLKLILEGYERRAVTASGWEALGGAGREFHLLLTVRY